MGYIVIGIIVLVLIMWNVANISDEKETLQSAKTLEEKRDEMMRLLRQTPLHISQEYNRPKSTYSTPQQIQRTMTEVKKPTLTITQKLDKAIREGRKVSITYGNYDGEYSERVLSDIRYNDEFEGYSRQHIKAFCHKRNEERTFKIARIQSLDLM